jgi:hypothetical protein
MIMVTFPLMVIYRGAANNVSAMTFEADNDRLKKLKKPRLFHRYWRYFAWFVTGEQIILLS